MLMSLGSFASDRNDSKRQRALPLPRASASMRTFTPDTSIASDVIPSANYGDRSKGRQPDMVVLHYTGMPDVEGAIRQLCTAGTDVSAHYIVLEDGRIVQCVPEAKRAWHAGVSSWAGEEDINSCSIGIEIVNRGHDWGYPEFPLRHPRPRAVAQLASSARTPPAGASGGGKGVVQPPLSFSGPPPRPAAYRAAAVVRAASLRSQRDKRRARHRACRACAIDRRAP